MPKRCKICNGSKDDEPPTKRRRRNDTPKEANNYFASKADKPSIKLEQLPVEVVMDVCDNMKFWHHKRIRNTSTRMRDVNNTYIMHEFLKQCHQCKFELPPSYKSIILLALHTATEAYLEAGFKTTFTGCLLPMLRTTNGDPFCPRIPLLTAFLLHFYKVVDEGTPEKKKQQSRLLSMMTLIKLLKQFRTFRIISDTCQPRHCRVIFEIGHSWIGFLYSRVGKEEDKRNCLAVVLTHLLIESLACNSFRRFWRHANDIYGFGHDTDDTPNQRYITKAEFVLTVHGTKKICSLFHGWLMGEQKIEYPLHMPNNGFTVLLEVHSDDAVRLGCEYVMRFEFGPLTDAMQILDNSD